MLLTAVLQPERLGLLCRSKKMGTRTVAYQDGRVVFFRAIMDNALGRYLKAGLPDTSGKYNDRVVRNEGRITGFLNEVEGRSAHVTFNGKTVKEKVLPVASRAQCHAAGQEAFPRAGMSTGSGGVNSLIQNAWQPLPAHAHSLRQV